MCDGLPSVLADFSEPRNTLFLLQGNGLLSSATRSINLSVSTEVCFQNEEKADFLRNVEEFILKMFYALHIGESVEMVSLMSRKTEFSFTVTRFEE